MKKMIALLLALIMVFSLVACSGSADTAKDTTTTDSTTTDTTGSDTTAEPASTEGSVINVCLASEPDTIDPALNSAVDGATMLAHLFSGLAKWSQDADGNLQIVADAATELPEGVENEDGTVTPTPCVTALSGPTASRSPLVISHSHGSALLPPSWPPTTATCSRSLTATPTCGRLTTTATS